MFVKFKTKLFHDTGDYFLNRKMLAVKQRMHNYKSTFEFSIVHDFLANAGSGA